MRYLVFEDGSKVPCVVLFKNAHTVCAKLLAPKIKGGFVIHSAGWETIVQIRHIA
jgi:hypothetical protein